MLKTKDLIRSLAGSKKKKGEEKDKESGSSQNTTGGDNSSGGESGDPDDSEEDGDPTTKQALVALAKAAEEQGETISALKSEIASLKAENEAVKDKAEKDRAELEKREKDLDREVDEKSSEKSRETVSELGVNSEDLPGTDSADDNSDPQTPGEYQAAFDRLAEKDFAEARKFYEANREKFGY